MNISIINVVHEWTRTLHEIAECPWETAWQRLIARLRPLLACCARTPWIHWLPAPVQPLKVPEKCYVSSDGRARHLRHHCDKRWHIEIMNTISDSHQFGSSKSAKAFWASLWMRRLRQRLQCHPRQLQRCPLQLREQKQAGWRRTIPNHDLTWLKPNFRISWISKKVRPADWEKHRKAVYSLYVVWCHFYVCSIFYCLVKKIACSSWGTLGAGAVLPKAATYTQHQGLLTRIAFHNISHKRWSRWPQKDIV